MENKIQGKAKVWLSTWIISQWQSSVPLTLFAVEANAIPEIFMAQEGELLLDRKKVTFRQGV